MGITIIYCTVVLAVSLPPLAALPPGPVQNLSVAGALDGDVVDLHIQWITPVEVNTDGEVQYDVLLHGGSGILEHWDNHSLLHKYRVKVGRTQHLRDVCKPYNRCLLYIILLCRILI